jgi:hypothetical protein
VILFLLACTPEPTKVAVRTTIGSDRDQDPSGVVAGAGIDVYTGSTESFSHAEADEDGAVTLQLPFGHSSFVVLHADGYAPTSYSLGPFFDEGTLPDGTLWLRSNDGLAALKDEFGSACPNIDAEGGVVLEGEVRLFIDGQELDTLPLVTTATVRAVDGDGTEYPGCYLDDAGKPSADATETGETGRFAVFGAEPGTLTLDLVYEIVADKAAETNHYLIVAEESGAVPYYPALVFAF